MYKYIFKSVNFDSAIGKKWKLINLSASIFIIQAIANHRS